MTDMHNPTDWYSEDAATFGDRVAAARDVTGLSQSELAARLGVKDKTIRAWENDTAEPRANKLQMLAGVLNVSMRWLLTGEGEGVTAPENRMELGSDIAGLLAEMRELRGQAATLAERIGRLEKRLRAGLTERVVD
jgi:transcriptional regulator with XRE-family HTH domain